MGNVHIHVGSITNAMRGKRLLEREGITAYVHRASVPEQGDGCGYSLLVTGNARRAEQILQESGVRVVRVREAL